MATIVQQTNGEKEIFKADEYTLVQQQLATMTNTIGTKAAQTDMTNVMSQLAENAKIYVNVKAPPNNLTACVGDGVTDDSSAMNAIISYVANNGGGQVYFPPGTYMGWVDLYQKHNVTLIGAGMSATTIKLNTNNRSVISTYQTTTMQNTENLAIERMTLDGNYNNIGANTLNSGAFNDNYQLGFYMFQVMGCRIEKVKVQNTWCTNDLYVSNTDEQSHSLIKDCIFINCGDKQVTLSGGATVYNANFEIDNDSRNITVENCMFIGSDPTIVANNKQLININCGDSTNIKQQNIKWINNKFSNQAVGIYGIGNLWDWLIDGNEFYNVGQCVYLYGNQTDSHGAYPQYMTISKNKVINTVTATLTGDAAIRVGGSIVDIFGNVIDAPNIIYGMGITAYAPSDASGTMQYVNAKIHHNEVRAKGFNNASNGGVSLFGDGLIESNTIECSDNTQVGCGIFTYPSSANGRKYRIFNNQVYNFTSNNAMYLPTDATILKANNYLTATGTTTAI